LGAAAVVGSRFGVDLLTVLGIEPSFDELVKAEPIDQVGFTQQPQYVFCHPMIRAVAYESQLKIRPRPTAPALGGRDRKS
jgi:adenylate cyclase